MYKTVSKYKSNIILNEKYIDFINIQISKLMLEHLEYIKIKPKRILSVHMNEKVFSNIKKLYPNVKIININKHNFLFGKNFFYKNNIIKNNSIDIIMFNISVPWYKNFILLINEIKRVSKKNAILLFNGIHSFNINKKLIYNKTLDIYNVGNILLKYELKNIAIDNIMIKMKYESYKTFFLDIIKSKLFLLGNIKLNNLDMPINLNINVNFGHANL